MNFPSQIFFNYFNHGYRAAILKKNSLRLLPFYVVVVTYFFYEKVRRTMRTVIVSNLLKYLAAKYQRFTWWMVIVFLFFSNISKFNLKSWWTIPVDTGQILNAHSERFMYVQFKSYVYGDRTACLIDMVDFIVRTVQKTNPNYRTIAKLWRNKRFYKSMMLCKNIRI